jgi:translation initiation factor 4E
VKPEWEDPNFLQGGKWALRVFKVFSNKFWEDLVLALIGDSFTDADEVLGLVLNLRPGKDTL